MRRSRLMWAAGVAAFLLFLLAFLPASILLRFLPSEIALTGVSGTVWRGQAQSVIVRDKAIGALAWTNRPWRLTLLQLEYGVRYRPPGGEVSMDVTLRGRDRLDISNAQGRLPIVALDGLLGPAGWNGQAELDVQRLALLRGFPETAEGTLVLRDLTAPGPRGLNMGTFELTLGAGAVGTGSIAGRLRDLGSGPMQVRATLELRPDRSYLLSGEVSAGPDASDAVQRNLAFLGPADSLGRRPFSVEGTL